MGRHLQRTMAVMRPYLLSLGAGLVVGIVYSLLNVRSPAPPVVALIGLFGILLGEQIIPVAKHLLTGLSIASAWRRSQCTPHVFGHLPGRHTEQFTEGFGTSDLVAAKQIRDALGASNHD